MALGNTGTHSFYAWDISASEWYDYTNYLLPGFRVTKELNTLWHFEGTLAGVNSTTRKADIVKNNEVIFYVDATLFGKFVLEEPDYQTDGTIKISGYVSTGNKISGRNVRRELTYANDFVNNTLSDVLTGSSNAILREAFEGTALTEVSLDAGVTSMKLSFNPKIMNKLKAIDDVFKKIDGEWWFNTTGLSDSPHSRGTDYLYGKADKGIQSTQYTFELSGTKQNCIKTSKNTESETKCNHIVVKGVNEGIANIYTENYEATTNKTHLDDDLDTYSAETIDTTETAITVYSTAGFPASGRIKIDDEYITYTWKDSTHFGRVADPCTRGANSTLAVGHKNGCDILNWGTDGTDVIITVDSTTLFASTGTIRIGLESITYTGKSATTFTGCTRTASSAYTHLNDTEAWDAQYTLAVPQSGSEIHSNGVYAKEITDETAIKRDDLDKRAEYYIDNCLTPERITVLTGKTVDVLHTNTVELGDKVTVTDSRSGLSSTYRIYGMILTWDANGLVLKLDLSVKKFDYSNEFKEGLLNDIMRPITSILDTFTEGFKFDGKKMELGGLTDFVLTLNQSASTSPKEYFMNTTAAGDDPYIFSDGNDLKFYDPTTGAEVALSTLSGGAGNWSDEGAYLKPGSDGDYIKLFESGGVSCAYLVYSGSFGTLGADDELRLNALSTSANTEVYVYNSNGTYKANLKIENDVYIEGDALKFNYGGANADSYVLFASDASLLWDESEDSFNFNKTVGLYTLDVWDTWTDTNPVVFLTSTVAGNDGYLVVGSKEYGTNADATSHFAFTHNDANALIEVGKGELVIDVATRVGDSRLTSSYLEINHYGSGNRYAYIDLVGDDTYTDYGLRLLRYNNGANSNSILEHRGAGILEIKTTDTNSDIYLHPDRNIRIGGNLVGETYARLKSSTGYNVFIEAADHIELEHGAGDHVAFFEGNNEGLHMTWDNTNTRLDWDEDLYMPLDDITCDKITRNSVDPPVLIDDKMYTSDGIDCPTAGMYLSGTYTSKNKIIKFPMDYRKYPDGSDEFIFFAMVKNIRIVATSIGKFNDCYIESNGDNLIIHTKENGEFSIMLSGERCDVERDNNQSSDKYDSVVDVKRKRVSYKHEGKWVDKETKQGHKRLMKNERNKENK